ncbi:MAG: DUF371 domain-containing protein [Candidatus Nitrosopelagicus sp.]|jgi:hypothetical protein|nr:DUF371 domain-containing protein [Candidatus Nitrosopelagicus sp.]|tara:strand:- start:542 stop:958 length:417 start_codon:yes stop_codon:yes gene_type:complete
MKIEIPFRGHKNILSLHEKTLEITKEPDLTINGDCIVGINADLACKDLPENFKKNAMSDDAKITFTIKAGKHSFSIHGNGSKKLTLKHPKDIVLRKSAFVCTRTLAIKCDKASSDIPRGMVHVLQNPKIIGKMIIEVK